MLQRNLDLERKPNQGIIQGLIKLYKLLDPRERRNAFLVFLMMLFLGLLEAAGVTSIMPFISVLSNPEIVNSNSYLANIYRELEFSNTNSFLLFLATIVFLVTLGRVAFAALTHYSMVRFYNMRNLAISTRVLNCYLHQPYSWFLNQHSSDLGRIILSEVDQVVNGTLKPGLEIISHSIVSFCLVGILIVVDPMIAISAFLILGSAYGAVYLGLRKYLTRIGTDRLHANKQRYQIAQEILEGIKEVKVSGSELAYLRRFTNYANIFHRRRSSSNLLNQLPRYFFEALTIGGMLSVVIVLLIRLEGDLSKILPIVGLYAFTGLRLLPLLQQIYANLAKMAFGQAALDRLDRDLKSLPNSTILLSDDNPSAQMALQQCISLQNINFTYPDAPQQVLSNLSFEIPARSTVGFVGATGAGKSTVVDLLLGLLEPQSGEIRVDDIAINKNNVRSWQRSIGYVPQHIFLLDDTVTANIAFGVPSNLIDKSAVERAARHAELHNFITEELSQGYETMVGERGVRLSGGQRQRLGIARALYNNPPVLAMDEATSALDNFTERAIIDSLCNLSLEKTILIIAHRLSTVKACDNILYLEDGKLKASGTYDELYETNNKFREMANL